MRRPKLALAIVVAAFAVSICFEQALASQPICGPRGGQLIGLSDEIVVLPKRGRNNAKKPTASPPATVKPGGLVGLSDEIIFISRKNRKRN
jgi:hypothetical protein